MCTGEHKVAFPPPLSHSRGSGEAPHQPSAPLEGSGAEFLKEAMSWPLPPLLRGCGCGLVSAGCSPSPHWWEDNKNPFGIRDDEVSPGDIKRLCISFQLSSNRIYLTLKKNIHSIKTQEFTIQYWVINRHTNGPLQPLSLGSSTKMKGGLTSKVQTAQVGRPLLPPS